MIEEIEKLLEQHLAWLRERTCLRIVGDSVEITTPRLDRHNDCLQIYAVRDSDGLILTDDGYVLEDLELAGCNINSTESQASIRTFLNGFGVQQKGTALQVKASADNFSLNKHNLVQAMMAISNLLPLASPSVKSVFSKDVAAWLDLSRIPYTPDVKFIGKSGYNHVIDFVISKSDTQPERAVFAINLPGRSTVQAMTFSWIDIKDGRSADTRAYAILNDSTQNILQDIECALLNYNVKPVRWSQRDQALVELAS